VNCTDSAIRVSFNKTELDARDTADNNRPFNIAWKGYKQDFNCLVNSTNTSNIMGDMIWIEAEYPNNCGLTEMTTADYIYYNSTVVVTYGKNPGGMIRREEYDFYEVSCIRNRTVIEKITDNYFNTSIRSNGTDIKNNTVDYNFTLSHSDNTGGIQTEYKLGDTIKFDLVFNTDLSTVKGILQKCWSTSDGSNNQYSLISNRCADDEGTSIGIIDSTSTEWTTEAYRYIGEADSSIYVECLVRVCLKTETSGDCQTCGSRKRRDVDDDQSTGQMALVRSPVFYIIEKEQPTQASSQSSSSVLEGTNGTIIIVLLATLVFVIAVVVIKKVFFPTLVAVPSVSMKGVDNQGLA